MVIMITWYHVIDYNRLRLPIMITPNLLADACDAWLGLLSEPALQPPWESDFKMSSHSCTSQPTCCTRSTEGRSWQWLDNCDPVLITGFISFQAKAAPFPGSYFSAETINISSHTWWQGAAVCSVDPAFADLAQRLTTLPSSSASIERVFSTFSFIHNKIRNRLNIQKASKLVFCYRILGGT